MVIMCYECKHVRVGARWVPVFEKAHALMKRTCNGTYTENCYGDVARWLTLTRIPGSICKALTYLGYSIETSNVEVRQYSLAYWLFHAITFERSTFTKITIKFYIILSV